MSAANNQKVRRNGSPSTRQGPLRATQQFSLYGGSPSRKPLPRITPTSSPTLKSQKRNKARSHSETGFVSDRRSPSSTSSKVEKPRALRVGSSLESINLYLSGQWPKDGKVKSDAPSVFASYIPHATDGVFKKDTHTQTPDDWDDVECSGRKASHGRYISLYKRSQSVGSGDNWSLRSREIKAKLQRKDGGSSSRQSQTSSHRFSPVHITSSLLPTTTPLSASSQPIKIPTPTADSGLLRGTPGKARASVEGLNQEVEKLIICGTRNEEEASVPVSAFEYPDGHRAPIPEFLCTRSVDTQTPSQSDLLLYASGDILIEPTDGRPSSQASTDTEGSRPQSVSPSFIPGTFELDEPESSLPSTGCNYDTTSFSLSPRAGPSSPNPKNHFVRLPPDGAEKLKVVDEIVTIPRMKHFLTPAASIRLQPSERSAFHSLLKVPTIDLTANRTAIPVFDDTHFEPLC